MDQTGATETDDGSELPPFLRSWKNVYLAVLAYLAFVISALSLLSYGLNPPLG